MSAAILAFPERNKGRKRKSASHLSMGRVILDAMQHHRGEEPPANVATLPFLLDRHGRVIREQPPTPEREPNPLPERSPELAFCLALYGAMHENRRRIVRGQLELIRESEGQAGGDWAARVLNMLERR